MYPRGRQQFRCYLLCLKILIVLVVIVVSVDLVSTKPDNYHELKRVAQVGEAVIGEWMDVLTKGKIRTVNWFHKGLSQKFEIVFETGHVCSGKPILPEGFLGVQSFPTKDYNSLTSRQQRSIKRAEWEYQGWSEIVAFHVDKILGFYRKPPIVGRYISSKELYANDPTWTGLWKRTIPSYKVPIALLPWIEGLQRGIPSLEVRDYLIGNFTGKATLKLRIEAGDASTKLVFDYLVDDHDTQGIQNWKADITGKLIHWDSGLGWRDGPYPRTACYDVLCGTKQWKGVEHHEPNPETCNRICKFRRSVVDTVMAYRNETDSKQRLSYHLKESLKQDPLYPVFNLGLWRYYNYNKDGERSGGETAYLNPEQFFLGMDSRIQKIAAHMEECHEKLGDAMYLVE